MTEDRRGQESPHDADRSNIARNDTNDGATNYWRYSTEANNGGSSHNVAQFRGMGSTSNSSTFVPSTPSRLSNVNTTAKNIHTSFLDDANDLSPTSIPASRTLYTDIANGRSNQRMSDLGNYRRGSSGLATSFTPGDAPPARQIPTFQHTLPTAVSASSYIAPWDPKYAAEPTSVFSTSFYNDSDDNLSQASQFSPGFRPGNDHNRTGGVVDSPNIDFFHDARRPSVASVTTASSTGSRSSQALRTGRQQISKLATFFGEDRPGEDRPQHLTKSRSHSHSHSQTRGRKQGSISTQTTARGDSPGSINQVPTNSAPSRDVTPFLFQDHEDIQLYGEAPVRSDLSGPDRARYLDSAPPARPHFGRVPTKLHLPHLPHRHHKGEDDAKAARPGFARKDSSQSVAKSAADHRERMPSAMSNIKSNPPRQKSPSSSIHSNHTMNSAKEQPKAEHHKSRGVMGLFRKPKNKDESNVSPGKMAVGAGKSIQDRNAGLRTGSRSGDNSDVSPWSRHESTAGSDLSTFDGAGASQNPSQHPNSRAFGGFRQLTTGAFKRRGPGRSLDDHDSVDPKQSLPNIKQQDQVAMGGLDMNAILNIKDMEGIVSTDNMPLTPLDNPIFFGHDSEQADPNLAAGGVVPNWNAPESWAVKGLADENIGRLSEIDEEHAGASKADENATPYCIRIFKTDGTFSTLSMPLHANVTEIINQLSRKIHTSDSGANYQIVMRKHAQQRILGHTERPVNIQRKLLQQAGYEEQDRIEDVGREDNSYLCRFSFIPARESGYASQQQDSGFNKLAKFSHIDLSGRNLITIPIALYSKANDIVSLNLSRNLSLDVPMDFIQACLNLRELKFNNNEAWALPKSLTAAVRLSVLDISNNCLEQLDHIDLKKLTMLNSLKIANNLVRVLPDYFGSFKHLRVLNMSSNFLDTFPSFLCNLSSLVDLDLSFNAIDTIPTEIGNLQNLERFAITNNRLKGLLPEEIGLLRNLREADIRYNSLTSIDIIATLPNLILLSVDHNSVTKFEGTFEKIAVLRLNSNPVTRFEIKNVVPTLTQLVLSNAKLASLPDAVYDKMPNLNKLILDNNHFVSLSSHIGKLRNLEHLSIAVNSLGTLPPEIGCLNNLRTLDVRQNNLNTLPPEIWWASRLETLNVSSNVMSRFPRHSSKAPPPIMETNYTAQSERSLPQTPDAASDNDTVGPLLASYGAGRRPSQVSAGLLSVGPSPVATDRNNSLVSLYGKGGRKTSVVSRNASQPSTHSNATVANGRKDSGVSARMANTLALSLTNLYLADNVLEDDVFDELTYLGELRVLNLSYNSIAEIPPRALRAFPQLIELYLSGNDLTSLPSDDFTAHNALHVLYLNGNNLQTLPAELGNAKSLNVLDCASNYLKYNVSNLNYDWNWNYNPALKSLNLSGNKRLEIKPGPAFTQDGVVRESRNFTDFSNLHQLRILGLMDVTLTIPTIPDETEDRRVRTSGSMVGSLAYGMADSLGRKDEHLSIIDMVVPRFNGQEAETLLGLFDGESLSNGGSKIAKYLHENFGSTFIQALAAVRETQTDTIEDALRRSFLSLNKDLATAATLHVEDRTLQTHRGSASKAVLSKEDLNSGGVATVMYLTKMDLYIANVGNAQAIILHSDGTHHMLTKKHDPADPAERQRIRDAGGWVSRTGKLNDVLDVSRAFGYVQLMPAVQAAPFVSHYALKETDDMIILASKELWEYVPVPLIVDVARSCKDLMATAQKLRDFAIAFGSTAKIMVMCLSVSDLKKRTNRANKTSMYLSPGGISDDSYLPSKRGRRGKGDAVEDSGLRRLEAEVAAPIGDINIVFTDIKGSTMLWDTMPEAMRTALRLHNDIMRRNLRLIGGYEVKTEGDAFIASFPTATSALIWCFTCQQHLLKVEWPEEILNHPTGQDIHDSDGNLIFRGVSVRMGIHYGAPVCEVDPVTKRMDYFGPMVNKAARISATADGGQISVSQDFIMEIQRCLHSFGEDDRANSTGSADADQEERLAEAIRQELRQLSVQGFEIKEMGERKLKGLENPEFIFLIYPHILAGRMEVNPRLGIDAKEEPKPVQETKKASIPTLARTNEIDDSEYGVTTDMIWSLWGLSLRLEMICNKLEVKGGALSSPEYGLMERMKNLGSEVPQQFMLNFFRHLTTRIEAAIAIISMRNILLATSDKPATFPLSSPVDTLPADENFLEKLSSPLDMLLQQMKDEQEELRAYRERFGEIMPERINRKAALQAGVLDKRDSLKSKQGLEARQSRIVELVDDDFNLPNAEKGRRLSVQITGGGSHANL